MNRKENTRAMTDNNVIIQRCESKTIFNRIVTIAVNKSRVFIILERVTQVRG